MKILITGATGFVGGATVKALLQRGLQDQLRFLVRAETPAEGLTRLRHSLARFEVDEAALELLTASQLILGDLADVPGFADDPRLDTVTHVVNCAAVASFGNHPRIWPVNVDGTFAFAQRMAAVGGLQRFLHIGTAMACGPGQERFVGESWNMPAREHHLVTYTASKAEVERQMSERLPGLPLVVVRPSIVVGHSRLGCAPSSSIFWVFRMGHEIDHFMCDLDDYVDIIPVDYCAEAISHLLLSESLCWNLYHVSAGRAGACKLRDIYLAMNRAGKVDSEAITYRRISKDQIGALVPMFQQKLGIGNRRLLARALSLYGSFSALHYVFDNLRLLAEGTLPPPRFTDYIDVCMRSTAGMSLKEQMLDDFK
ncbi:MAG: SDR family oxidoreductase [Nevskia sp.]|nr:SDR family oxidoreductase [Nevskia sp.]